MIYKYLKTKKFTIKLKRKVYYSKKKKKIIIILSKILSLNLKKIKFNSNKLSLS
jgi:hypothetical protein